MADCNPVLNVLLITDSPSITQDLKENQFEGSIIIHKYRIHTGAVTDCYTYSSKH